MPRASRSACPVIMLEIRMLMYAAVYEGHGSVVVSELPDPIVPPSGGLLAVEGSGVCIADGEVIRGLGGPPHRPPIVLGHEIVGRVAASGPAASGQIRTLQGRRVIVDDARPCGKCAFCRQKAPRCCRSPHYGHIPDEPGASWGGYAECVTLDDRSSLHVLEEDLPLELATFAFPLASGIEWTHRLAALRADETVAVVGNSRMGVASVAAAALRKPRRIVLYGSDGGGAARLAAASLGAEVADASVAPDGVFDVVVIVTEATAAETAFGFGLAATMGRVIAASCATDTIAVEPESIRRRGLTIRGGRGHSSASMDEAIAALTTRTGWFSETYFEIFPLDQAHKALATMHDRNGTAFGTHRVITPPSRRAE
jgi:threonine dehydrogenase-like Zn-dependent dehydrogenase